MPPLDVRDFEVRDTDPVVRMCRESFEFGVGLKDTHPIEQQVAYFEREVIPNHRVRVARASGLLVGLLASNAESVAQLHVRVGYHRLGIGRMPTQSGQARVAGKLVVVHIRAELGGVCLLREPGVQGGPARLRAVLAA